MTRSDLVLGTAPLGFPWPTIDPFLFCVHHDDDYPRGDERMAPAASLAGRALGRDFEGRDGWRMYHGEVVPGFPQHPHRGFETVTIVRRGFVDHADSLGAAARFGAGDVQWITAGQGLVHSEMFPLLERERGNPLELFQIWLNLPRANKRAEPHFAMLWRDAIPQRTHRDEAGRTTEITVIAGTLGDASPPPPPPKSWAADPRAEVAILSITMAPGARWTLPAASPGVARTLYFFAGDALRVGERELSVGVAAQLRDDAAAELTAGDQPAALLLLQGRPLQEPVVQHGPFVMNSVDEVQEAYRDYQRTRFGGWPWPSDDPVHARDEPRFARYPDGRVERA
ncbi:pirin family protein [Haliangium ochraceum]|uniref:Pirin domain protein n=1 Tax=Haliangium ochraceum (strain DSM 14365 / JCM 11303 / SMP-2) TaxID=502025 RepID=D0LL91_HALO1|nr:pirin family protein [Haliangium ochraceum]ACY18587.1 Pirin domain protein [Haliangium ochraceum DSM 14365]